MRVLQVIPSLAAGRGGPTNVLFNLVAACAREGITSEVLATRADLSRTEEAEVRERLGSVPLHLGTPVGPARLDFAPTLLPRLIARVRAVDLVHIHTVFTFPVAVAPIVCRALGRPYIVRTVGTLDEACLSSRSTGYKRLLLDLLGRGNLVGADAVQVTSELEAKDVKALVPAARVHLLEVGVTDRGCAPPSSGRGVCVGHLGRLHAIKNIEVLIRALPLLASDATLALAGAGEPGYERSLRALADSLGVGSRVRFLGHLDEEEKQRFFSSCDVLAFPSSHESFGVAIAEAMAAGRAVVVSPHVGTAPAIARAGAGIVAEAAPRAFAAALTTLLDDGTARQEIATAARAHALSHWSWDVIGSATLALYEEILARRGS